MAPKTKPEKIDTITDLREEHNAAAANVVEDAELDTDAAPVELVLSTAAAGGGLMRLEKPEDITNVLAGWERAPIHVKLSENDVITGEFRGFGKKRGKEKIDELTGEVTPVEYDAVLMDCGGTVGLVSFLSAYELADGIHNLRIKPGDMMRVIRGKTEYVEKIGRVVTRYAVACLKRKPDPIVRDAKGAPK